MNIDATEMYKRKKILIFYDKLLIMNELIF